MLFFKGLHHKITICLGTLEENRKKPTYDKAVSMEKKVMKLALWNMFGFWNEVSFYLPMSRCDMTMARLKLSTEI